jgi:hypothetical protein
MAMATLIESTVRVTTRHSDSEPIASEAATASFNRDDATGAEGLSKPVAPGDRIMAEILQCAGRITRRTQDYPGIAGNIAAVPARKWQNGGKISGLGSQASAAMPAGSPTPVSGCQSMETNPAACSTRRNQARIAGKVARS